MKKVTVCAMIAAMTVTGAAALPVQAATNAGNSANCNGKGYYVFTGGKVSDLENIKNRLDELCGQLNGNTTTITFPGCNFRRISRRQLHRVKIQIHRKVNRRQLHQVKIQIHRRISRKQTKN